MNMIFGAVVNATDFRNEQSKYIDEIVRVKPKVLKRNRDFVHNISQKHIHEFLRLYRFVLEWDQEPDGSYSGTLEGFDLVSNAPSLEELKTSLALELIEYAKEYYENFELYHNSPNRQAHLPFIYKVLIQDDLQAVTHLIDG